MAIARRRTGRVDSWPFPPGLDATLARARPELSADGRALVLEGLRDWFRICRTGTRRTFFAMPSRAVDDAWHEFILFTREYHAFCRSVLGHYLHHSPAEAPSATASTEDGLLATWRAACALEGLSSEDPAHLPRLFAIDERLGLSDGVRYERRPKNPSEDARIPAGCPDGVVWIPTDGGGITGASAKRGRGSARCGGSFGGCGSGDVGGGSCGGGGCGGGG